MAGRSPEPYRSDPVGDPVGDSVRGRQRVRRVTPGEFPAVLLALGILSVLLVSPASTAEEDASTLESLAQSYRELGLYRDRGTVEITAFRDGEQHSRRLRFATVAAPPDRWRLEIETEDGARHVLWRQEDETWLYDAREAKVFAVPSLGEGLASGLDPAVRDALLVPRWLAGEGIPWISPSARRSVAVEPHQPCGDGTGDLCRMFSAVTDVGRLRLWIGEEDARVRRLEVEQEVPPEPLPADDDRGVTRAATEYLWLRGQHTEIEARRRTPSDPAVLTEIVFTPPPEARRVAPRAAQRTPPSLPEGIEPVEVFRDEITVALFPVTVRVVDRHGRPVAGLGTEDFRVRVDGTEVPVVSVDWERPDEPWTEGLEQLERELTPEQWRELGLVEPDPGQLVIVFVQSDFNAVRIKGHLSFLPHVRSLLRTLAPEDRVAVVAFGSHLELWQDFTRDREAAYRAVEQAVRFGAVPDSPGTADPDGPRLAEHFDDQAAHQAAWVEQGLGVVAEALEALSRSDPELQREEKVMVFLGWGVGRYDGFGYTDNPHWLNPALETLYRARTTVHVLDVTPYEVERGGKTGVGPAHTMERGLRRMAEDTGGTFARTYQFPAQAWKGLAQTVSGYYVLRIDGNAVPPLPEGGGRVLVELRAPRGRLLIQRPVVLYGDPRNPRTPSRIAGEEPAPEDPAP